MQKPIVIRISSDQNMLKYLLIVINYSSIFTRSNPNPK
jgi:hypothetical protein